MSVGISPWQGCLADASGGHSGIEGGECMRHVIIVLIIYSLAVVLLLTSFALDVYYSSSRSVVNQDNLLSVELMFYLILLFNILISLYSVIFLMYSLFKRSFTAVWIYALIISTAFTIGPALEMPIKGQMIALFPQLCLETA